MSLRRILPVLLLSLLVFAFLRVSSRHPGSPSENQAEAPEPSGVASLYVCPKKGIDSNPGTLEEPLETIHHAVLMSREIRRKSKKGTPFNIILMKGVHQISKTIELTEEDSGTNEAPLTIKGQAQKGSVLSGGVDLDPKAFKVLDEADLTIFPFDKKEDLYKIDLSSLGVLFESEEGFPNTGFGFPVLPYRPEIFFDEKPLRLARFPNEGYLTTGVVAHRGEILGEEKDPTDLSGINGAQFKPEGIPRENILLWENQKNIWAFGYWQFDWAEQASKVSRITSDVIELVGATSYGVTNGSRYYLFNIPQELDSPGEYFIDYEKQILYIYPPSPIGASTKIQISWMKDPLITFNKASHIRLEKLTLETSRGSGVQVLEGEGIGLHFLVLRNFGNVAVIFGEGEGGHPVGSIGGSKFDRNFYDTMWNRRAGSHHTLSHSKIYNTGAMGVILGGGDRKTLTKGMNRVSNCEISFFSRIFTTYRPAVYIDGVGNYIANNLIHHGPHSGILAFGNEHVIQGNELSQLILDTSDAGLIYIGRDFTARGIRIQRNLLHHSHSPLTHVIGSQGVYLDDLSSGVTVIGNIFYKLDWAFVLGGGRDVVFKNNLVLYCNRTLRADARGLKEKYAQHLLPTGDLMVRYHAVPVNSPIWKKTYPKLGDLLTHHPELPMNNKLQQNVFYMSKAGSKRSLVINEPVIKHGKVGPNWIGGEEKEEFEGLERQQTEEENKIDEAILSKDKKVLVSFMKDKFSEILKKELPEFTFDEL